MTQMLSKRLAVILLVILFAVPDVYAHRPEPGNEDAITRIKNASTSYAYYRELRSEDQVHIYEFEAKAGQFFHAGINIPQIKGLEDFGVTMALLGPGLPPIAEHPFQTHSKDDAHGEDAIDDDHDSTSLTAAPMPNWLRADLQSETIGSMIVESETSEDFFEPFTQTRYWGRQKVELDLPENGTYYLLIWNPMGVTGKYVLDTGTEEVFGLADLLRFPGWWLNARVYFEQTPQLVGVSVAALSGLIGLIVYLLRR